jgi:hypothetical protein
MAMTRSERQLLLAVARSQRLILSSSAGFEIDEKEEKELGDELDAAIEEMEGEVEGESGEPDED